MPSAEPAHSPPPVETAVMPSYHDLHITTAEIERTSIFNLPYGFRVECQRTTGWLLYDSGVRMSPHLAEPPPRILAGEYEGRDKWLVLDVAGHVIVDSRRDSDDDDE